MSTIAANRAELKWEYLELGRKTEAYLINELNQLGEVGWELVSVIYHKDLKGLGESWSWTAFLKRPYTGQSAIAHAAATAAAGAAPSGGVRRQEQADDGDIFEVRD